MKNKSKDAQAKSNSQKNGQKNIQKNLQKNQTNIANIAKNIVTVIDIDEEHVNRNRNTAALLKQPLLPHLPPNLNNFLPP